MYTSRWRSTGKRRVRHRGIANYEMCEAVSLFQGTYAEIYRLPLARFLHQVWVRVKLVQDK